MEGCNHTSWEKASLPLLAKGSEHSVYLDDVHANVFKVTLPDTFGEYYYLVAGLVNQEKCTPIEYLIRLHFWRKIFGNSPLAIGVTESGQIVSRQEFISGNVPLQNEVDDYLLESGLSGIKVPCWLWKRPYEEFDVWVGDARCDNFVKTTSGIVPIDIRVWFSSQPSS